MKKPTQNQEEIISTPTKPGEFEEFQELKKEFYTKYGQDFYSENTSVLLQCPKCEHQNNILNPKCEKCKTSLHKQVEAIHTTYITQRLKQGYSDVKVKLDNYIPNAKILHDLRPYFYDKSRMFWLWNPNKCKYEITDDTDFMNFLDERLNVEGYTIAPKIKNNYLEAAQRVGRLKKPSIPKKKYIQFNSKAYNISDGMTYNIHPRFLFTNPIPWDLGESDDTPEMDRLFKEWVGEKNVITLYEILAYCCYADYPIQTIICLQGTGRNGKSQFLKVMKKFIGDDNTCSTDLDSLINSKNESFKLYKKLVCQMGETDYTVMRKTSLLKKLTGGDLIGFEKKFKDPFDDVNYAKLIMGSNAVPPSEDMSDGFVRRWLIITFPNEFPEGKEVYKQIPDQEYNNLALKVTKILPNLLKRGGFTNQGTIKERKLVYQMASNPLPIFIKTYCDINEDTYVSRQKLYSAYIQFLLKHKKKRVKSNQFNQALEEDGFYIEKTSKKINNEWISGRWVIGISLKDDWKEKIVCDNNAVCDTISYNNIPHESLIPFTITNGINVTNIKTFNTIFEILQNEIGKIVPIQNLQDKLGFDITEILLKLKKSGDYFEPKPGFIKKL